MYTNPAVYVKIFHRIFKNDSDRSSSNLTETRTEENFNVSTNQNFDFLNKIGAREASILRADLRMNYVSAR